MEIGLHQSEIRLRIVEAVLPRLVFPEVKRPSELLDALRDVEAWVLGQEAADIPVQPVAPEAVPLPSPPKPPRDPSRPTAEQLTYELLAEIARAGEPMPGNPELGRRLGRTPGAVSAYLNFLSNKGRIRVERTGLSRRVQIVDGGHFTGWSVPIDVVTVKAARPSEPAETSIPGQRRLALLQEFHRRVAQQVPVGTNSDLARAIGLPVDPSHSSLVAQALLHLVASGAVKVERKGVTATMRRRVWVKDLDAWTPWPAEAAHQAATPAAGHDASQRRFGTIAPEPSRVRALPDDNPAVMEGRTVFPHTVVDPKDSPRLLVSGHNNRKIGKTVEKGPWRGMPIYTLTLEERATCPRTCHHWGDCYGNAMQWARRHRHGPDLEARLHKELVLLQNAHPDGFVVRLHVLGDFYSFDYAKRWQRWINLLPAAHVFGYTAWPRASTIGAEIDQLNRSHGARWRILFSVPATAAFEPGQAITVNDAAEAAGATLCPAQSEATQACATCALCWNPSATESRRVAFLLHGRKVRQTPEKGLMTGAHLTVVAAAPAPPLPEPVVVRLPTSPLPTAMRPLPAPTSCEWIEGDPRVDATHCGRSTVPGKSYCQDHFARVYQPPKRKPQT